MERFTISLNDSLAADFDSWIQSRSYSNRSEAIRDLIRKEIETNRIAHGHAEQGVASVSYVYNHHERNLAERLANLQHDAHDLVIFTTHVHLDHDNCLESLFLQGPTNNIRIFADRLAAEPGVRHSVVNLIPVQIATHDHDHHHHHIHPLS